MIGRKTFVISKVKESGFEKSITLANGYSVCYQKDLNIILSDDRRICVLGDAWIADPEYAFEGVLEGINSCLKDAHHEAEVFNAVVQLERSFGGRYLLIADNYLFMDTVGMMSCYYSENGYSISNSIRTLCSCLSIEVKYPHYYKKNEGMYYIVGSDTMVDGIKRLLPSMVYDLKNQKLMPRPIITRQIMKVSNKKDRNELIQYFIRSFDCSLKNMQQAVGGQIWVSLTGGRDSRALISMLEHSGIDYKCFNYEYSGISRGDVEIPPEICDKLKKQFVSIKRDKNNYSEKRYKDFEIHSSGYANEECWNAYAYGQFDCFITEGPSVILDSGLWEIATDRYEWLGNTPSVEEYKSHYPNVPGDKLLSHSVDEYFRWINETPQKYMKVSDRIYMELCDGCWLSGLEQAYDILDGVTHLQPLNSRHLLEILFSFPNKMRMDKKLEELITVTACPVLKEIAYEDKFESLAFRRKKKIKHILNRAGLLNYYRKIRKR